MTTSQKLTWGLILNVGGGLSTITGLALSASLVGACVGVPMVVCGLPLMVWGAIWLWQWRSERQAEVIAEGIHAGIQKLRQTESDPGDGQPEPLAELTGGVLESAPEAEPEALELAAGDEGADADLPEVDDAEGPSPPELPEPDADADEAGGARG